MNTLGLTPRTNDVKKSMRFSGGFDQPDGFNSVLTADVRTSGDAALTLCYRSFSKEHQWTIMLTSEQRKALAALLLSYEPKLFVEDQP